MAIFLGLTAEWRSLFRWPQSGESASSDEARRRDDDSALRVVSWNVAGGSPLGDLEPLNPDLCLFQECGFGRVALSGPWTGYQYVSGLDPATLSRHPVTTLPTRKVGPWVEPQMLRLSLPGGQAVVVANVRLVLPTLVVAVTSRGPVGSTGRTKRGEHSTFA